MFEDASLSVRRYAPSEVEYIHDWNQVVLPVEGAQDVDFGHTGGTIVAARGVLVPRGQPHMVRTRGDNLFVVLDLPRRRGRGQALSMDVWRQAREAPFFRLDAGLRHLLGYVAHDLAEESGDAATAGRMADLVIDALGRRLGRDHRPAGIRRALDLIHARYAEAIPVTELAAVAGLSVSAFNQHFRAAVGRAPCDYRIDLRIDCAARLLRAGDLSIAEIAVATGFSDQSALTRAMRRRLGTTPARLRDRFCRSG
jgi:AraC-like DNA-binding protein